MTPTQVNGALVAVASAGLALGVRLVASPLVQVAVPPGVVSTPAAMSAPATPSDSLTGALVARDVFRVTRRPSPVAYDPVRLAQPAKPPAPRPTLVLVGIVWDRGTDPTALVEGFPGEDGARPVRVGEAIASLRVKSITSGRVVITGLDTTWTLTVREPWR